MPTEQKFTWLADASGHYARIEDKQELRDKWTPLGWAVVPEPAERGDHFVWLQHEVHGGKALFSAKVAPVWADLGWHPSDPPEVVDLTHDPVLVDQADEPQPDAAPKKSAKAAASTKES